MKVNGWKNNERRKYFKGKKKIAEMIYGGNI